MIISQLRQRLEILWQLIEGYEGGGGGSGDAYTKQESDARYVQKVAGKGLSTNDFTDAYKNQISTNATNIGALDSAIDSLFTPSSITISEGGNVDADTLALAALHQPIRLNGKQFYFLGGDQSLVDYFAIDNNGNFVAYFARIQLSNGQVIILTSIVGSASPEDDGNDLFTTGGAYDLQVALETLISYKAELDEVYGYGTNIGAEADDLDNYKTIGRYYTQNSTQSGRLNHCPYTAAAGNLTVEELADTNVGIIVQQTWKVNSSDAQSQTYIRKWRGSSNQWSQWFRIPCAFDDFYMSSASLGTGDYATVDLNNLKTPGVYRCTSSNATDQKISNRPTAEGIQFILIVRGTYNTTSFRQELTPVDSANADKIYVRNCVGGTWTGWYVFTGAAVV